MDHVCRLKLREQIVHHRIVALFREEVDQGERDFGADLLRIDDLRQFLGGAGEQLVVAFADGAQHGVTRLHAGGDHDAEGGPTRPAPC